MTKLNFEVSDKIGRYTLTEFGGTTDTGEPLWWTTTDNGNEGLVRESKLRKELRIAELTPAFITALSSKAYDELCKEVGEDEIDRVLNRTPKVAGPSKEEQVKIAREWWETHPQVPRTRSNVASFDDYLVKSPKASFDTAFADLFYKLELNPKAAGIDGHGEGIRGEAAINKLTSTQVKQLQKSSPVVVPVDYTKLSEDEIIREVGKQPLTAEGFIAWTRTVDKERGIEQPVPPLLIAAREKIWASFFEINSGLVPTEELKAKLLETLKANGNLPVLNQNLNIALGQLIKTGDPVVLRQDSNARAAGGTRWQANDPRPKAPVVPFDDTPVVLSPADINSMSAAEYGRKLLDPNFRKAADALIHKVSS